MKQNKYLYLYIVQGRYSQEGWEDLHEEKNWYIARGWLKNFELGEPGFMHRMIRRRELNTEYEPAYQVEQEKQ